MALFKVQVVWSLKDLSKMSSTYSRLSSTYVVEAPHESLAVSRAFAINAYDVGIEQQLDKRLRVTVTPMPATRRYDARSKTQIEHMRGKPPQSPTTVPKYK